MGRFISYGKISYGKIFDGMILDTGKISYGKIFDTYVHIMSLSKKRTYVTMRI